MKDFPKWLLALAGTGLLPLLAAPFYLLGAVSPLGTAANGGLRFLLFVAANSLWVLPVAAFFVSLDRYRRGFRRSGVAVAVAALALTVACFAPLI